MSVEARQRLVMSETLNSLLSFGKIDLEKSSIYETENVQSARFVARSHASRVLMSDKITLICTADAEGHLKSKMDGVFREHSVSSGMLHFVPEHITQEYEFEGTTRNTLITLDAALVSRVIENNPEFRDCPIDEPRYPFRNPRLARKMNALIKLGSHQDVGWRSLTEACNVQIAVELLKSLSNGTERTVTPLGRSELQIIKDYVEGRLEENLGLDDASALLNRDIYGFGRAFKAATGITFHQYVTRMRVDEARRMLTETEMPLVEIAYACGFSSQSHLTTVLGRHLGITPGAMRQQSRA